uniref:Uncharacterized protein n=1 Tax=Micrurus spixii TaxID=129469 RepID=A0A2D4LJ66_9SAUR
MTGQLTKVPNYDYISFHVMAAAGLLLFTLMTHNRAAAALLHFSLTFPSHENPAALRTAPQTPVTSLTYLLKLSRPQVVEGGRPCEPGLRCNNPNTAAICGWDKMADRCQ